MYVSDFYILLHMYMYIYFIIIHVGYISQVP